MSKIILSLVAAGVMTLGGCSAVSSAVDTSFKLAQGLASLGVAGTKHSMNVAEGGFKLAQGGMEVAGGAIGLIDRANEAGHRARMRNLEQQRSADARGAGQVPR